MNPGMKGIDLTINIGGNEITVGDASEKQCLVYLISQWSNIVPIITDNQKKIDSLTKRVWYLMGTFVFVQMAMGIIFTKFWM